MDLNSSVEDLTRVNIEFLAEVEGLDDLQNDTSEFNENT